MLYGAKSHPPSVGPNVWQWIDPLGLCKQSTGSKELKEAIGPDEVTVYRTQPIGESDIVTGGAFLRMREKGKNLVTSNSKRLNLLEKATSSDPAVRVKSLQNAQASGKSSPFISTTMDRKVAEKGLENLKARGIEGEILTIKGPRGEGVDFESTFDKLGGRTKATRMKDAELKEFGIKDLFIPGKGKSKSKSGFEVIKRE